jgi:hypothetical protein
MKPVAASFSPREGHSFGLRKEAPQILCPLSPVASGRHRRRLRLACHSLPKNTNPKSRNTLF